MGLIFLLGVLFTVIIFSSFTSEKKDLLVIGDSLSLGTTSFDINEKSYINYFYEELNNNISSFNSSYAINNLSARDLYDLLLFNESLNDNYFTIKQLINGSEILVINIGVDELNNNASEKSYLYYMDLILNEIRKINDNQIYVIGVYSNSINLDTVNIFLNDICTKYNAYYVDISNITEDDYTLEVSYYLNEKGQIKVSENLINLYNKVNDL